jgi:integrase
MARPSRQVRVHGPYEHRRRFRIVVVDERGKTRAFLYETQKQAQQVKRSILREANATVNKILSEAFEMYETFLLKEKQNKPVSVDATVIRLRSFFPDHGMAVKAVDVARAQAYYAKYRTTPGPRTKKPPAVDTHRNVLAEVKTFMGWCVKKKLTPTNPFVGVEGVGRRKHGKPQLRIDESRKWMAVAMRLARQGDVGAVIALMTLLLGMRAGEIVGRVVRDVDDEGRLLWIPNSKTEAGRRSLEIPPVLQPFIQALVKNRRPEEKLFGNRWRDRPRKEVARICALAGVPKVCAHAMRGLHSTLAVQSGITGHVVAAALGHESFATTLQSYAKPEAQAAATQRTVLAVLEGGRHGDHGRAA